MANIYEAYQEYLNNIGEYVPSASDVYSGVSGLTSNIQNAGITGITGIKDALLPSGDDGNQGPPGPPGPPGTGGIGDLLDKYNELGFMGRGLVNTGIGLFAPQLAPLIGMYNIGKGIYDIGRNVLGYNDPRDPFGNVIDFNEQPDYDFGPDGDDVAFGGDEVTAKDAVAMGFGNVRGPNEEFSLKEQMENDGTDGGGTGSGHDAASSTDSGSGTHDDPGD